VLNDALPHEKLRRMEVQLQAFLTWVNDHFHIPVTQLPGQETMLRLGYETEWAPKSVLCIDEEKPPFR
jgi:hypothetical protein